MIQCGVGAGRRKKREREGEERTFWKENANSTREQDECATGLLLKV